LEFGGKIRMNNSIILLSKDAFGKFYLPTYGNKHWKTPNVDELAEKGTVFNRFYTAAPSSAMAYWSMFTGKEAMDSQQKNYTPVNTYTGETLFDKANALGYETHVIWDIKWMTTAKLYSECYGKNTTIHPLIDIRQPVGAHYVHKGVLVPDKEKERETFKKIEDCIRKITSNNKKVFIWMHLPHVLNGRVGYGTDIDVYDEIVGMVRKYFDDNNIFLTADHGNMNGTHNKIGYGFDVYEAAINIPLITPRYGNYREYNRVVSNTNLFELIFKREIPERKYVYSDSAYYAQLHRKLAIVGDRYKYIYNKQSGLEELYDLIEDPNENQNLMYDKMYDTDRTLDTPLRELYYYPHWDEIPRIRKEFRDERVRVWKNESVIEHLEAVYQKYGKIIMRKYRKLQKKIIPNKNK
jgi:hypothetical protein